MSTVLSQNDNARHDRRCLLKYLFWRGRSLYSRYPLPGKPKHYPLGIKRISDKPSEITRCEGLGEARLAEFRVAAAQGRTLFEKIVVWNPRLWRVIGLFWKQHYSNLPSAKRDRPHFLALLSRFKRIGARGLTFEGVREWQGKATKEYAVNTVNNQFRILRASYRHSKRKLEYDPTEGARSLKGGNVRGFYLTKFLFERNLKWLRNHEDESTRIFSKLYLAMWEMFRRPKEICQYRIEMVDAKRQCVVVPPEISKTRKFSESAISDRLWVEVIEPELSRGSGFLFVNSKGNPWYHVESDSFTYNKQMGKLVEEFGESGGWLRDCRRGSATHRVEDLCFEPDAVRDQGGWKDWSSFRRYQIGTLAHKRKALESGTNLVQKAKVA